MKATKPINSNHHEKGLIKPGTNLISTISAMPGGNAEKILRLIATVRSTERIKVCLEEWGDGTEGKIIVSYDGQFEIQHKETHEIILKLGVKEGLFLEDVPDMSSFSLKHLKTDGTPGLFRLPIGRLVSVPKIRSRKGGQKGIPRKERMESGKPYSTERLDDIAQKIVGVWVYHGRDWTDRKGVRYEWPYGETGRRIDSPVSFIVQDGGTVDDCAVLPKGTIRSSHPGSWWNSTILRLLKAGTTVLLHEFVKESTPERNICRFGQITISQNTKCWPGAAQWSNRNLGERVRPEFQAIANDAASPFAFHITATKTLYPSCRLMSSFILERLGAEKTEAIVRAVVHAEPERCYRMISEEGHTHQLIAWTGNRLIYDEGLVCTLGEAVESVVKSFREMTAVEQDHRYPLPIRRRVVLDSHFYTVLGALLTERGGTAHSLCGRFSYDYLLRGTDAVMHRIRNERIFQILKPFFGVERLVLKVYRLADMPHEQKDQYE